MAETFKLLQDGRLVEAGGQLLELGSRRASGAYAFNLINPEDVLSASPALRSYLVEKDLLNALVYVGMPRCPANYAGPIHVDGKCAEAINLPVINCADSDYVWFDAKIAGGGFRQTRAGHEAKKGVAEYRMCDKDTAVEISRVGCYQPVWFNTHIPHCGVNRSSAPRLVATLRFSRPLSVELL